MKIVIDVLEGDINNFTTRLTTSFINSCHYRYSVAQRQRHDRELVDFRMKFSVF